jgi:hypothetical protein
MKRVTFQVRLWCDECNRVIGTIEHVPEDDPRELVTQEMSRHVITEHSL